MDTQLAGWPDGLHGDSDSAERADRRRQIRQTDAAKTAKSLIRRNEVSAAPVIEIAGRYLDTFSRAMLCSGTISFLVCSPERLPKTENRTGGRTQNESQSFEFGGDVLWVAFGGATRPCTSLT